MPHADRHTESQVLKSKIIWASLFCWIPTQNRCRNLEARNKHEISRCPVPPCAELSKNLINRRASECEWALSRLIFLSVEGALIKRLSHGIKSRGSPAPGQKYFNLNGWKSSEPRRVCAGPRAKERAGLIPRASHARALPWCTESLKNNRGAGALEH